jgi:hypothetical protein
MIINRFFGFAFGAKESTRVPTTSPSPCESDALFRASLAFISCTSYPKLVATMDASDDLPMPGGPDSSTAFAPGFSLEKRGFGPP